MTPEYRAKLEQGLFYQDFVKEVETATSKGFLIPVSEAERIYALKIIEINQKEN